MKMSYCKPSLVFYEMFSKWTSIYFSSISWKYRFYFVFLQRKSVCLIKCR